MELTLFGVLIGHVMGHVIGATEDEKQKFALKGMIIVGLFFLSLSYAFGSPKNTLNYTLKNYGKIVYEGITNENRLNKRIMEHQAGGKKFNQVVTDFPKTRVEALKLEKQRIKRLKPKYNIHHNL